jgi:DNA (cytosine-5)-methyltransferase 1
VIGSLDGFGGNPFPTKCMHFTTLGEAIEDLPQINSGEGIDGPQPYAKEAVSGYAKRMRHGSSMVFNHQAMRHSQRLVTRFSTIPPGGKGYDIGRGTIHKKIVTVYKSNNQRLISELPSLCITANWQSSYIHPFLNRNLTVREAARIQSFPDTFIFTGQRACMSSNLLEREGRHSELHISQCHQVGNAVPPLLAEQIGKRLTVVDHKGDSDSDRSTLESWMVEEP